MSKNQFHKSRNHSHRPRGGKPAVRRERAEREDGAVLLYGVHTVAAALANPERRIGCLRATENAEMRLAEAIAARGAMPERVSPRDLDRLVGADAVHQGVVLETQPLAVPELVELAVRAADGRPLIVLDQVTDPHNVGAILRSSAVFGASGLVMTRRNSPPLDGALAKSASGALEHIPVALAQNLAKALQELKAAGVRVIGLDGEAPALLEDEALTGPVALVLGAEGKGLRQLTRETCDRLCSIATGGPIASLNVSNAAAIALHLAAMQRRRLA